MKLVMAIVKDEDVFKIMEKLSLAKYGATK